MNLKAKYLFKTSDTHNYPGHFQKILPDILQKSVLKKGRMATLVAKANIIDFKKICNVVQCNHVNFKIRVDADFLDADWL